MSNILEEVKKLLGKGAIELVPPGQESQGFYSTFFIVPKKDGGLRPILNLKPLNVYMEKSHFKMETLKINHSSPPCGGVGVHLRSVRCIPTNSHVSTSQEVSEVLCTGSSLPISSHALRILDKSMILHLYNYAKEKVLK
jgi:hypothetical protein